MLVFAVLGASVYGVIDHTVVNYHSGPLDYRFADSWGTLLPTQRWWYAFTRTVGPAPTLAPAILGQTVGSGVGPPHRKATGRPDIAGERTADEADPETLHKQRDQPDKDE